MSLAAEVLADLVLWAVYTFVSACLIGSATKHELMG